MANAKDGAITMEPRDDGALIRLTQSQHMHPPDKEIYPTIKRGCCRSLRAGPLPLTGNRTRYHKLFKRLEGKTVHPTQESYLSFVNFQTVTIEDAERRTFPTI